MMTFGETSNAFANFIMLSAEYRLWSTPFKNRLIVGGVMFMRAAISFSSIPRAFISAYISSTSIYCFFSTF